MGVPVSGVIRSCSTGGYYMIVCSGCKRPMIEEEITVVDGGESCPFCGESCTLNEYNSGGVLERTRSIKHSVN